MPAVIKFISPIWNNPLTRGILVGLGAILAVLAYGAVRAHQGAKKAADEAKAAAAKRRAEIEEANREAIAKADNIRVGAGSYADDRVSDKPAADHHYRD